MMTEDKLLELEAFRILDKLPLKFSDYVIMGSGILYVLGIKDLNSLNDLDLFVTHEGWEKVKHMGNLRHNEGLDYDSLELYNGLVEIFYIWDSPHYCIEDVMRNAYSVGKFQFMSLEDLVKWKKEMGREKDKEHLKLIENYLGKKKEL